MSALARPGVPVVATAAAAGLIQVVGTIGAAHNQPDRRPLDALAVALVLTGPAALLGLRRAPLAVVAVAFAAVAVYLGRGYAYGPVLVSAGLALVAAVQLAERRRVWLVTALGLTAVTVGHALAPGERLTWWQPVAVAGWIGLLLAGAELVRARRAQLRQAALAAERERQRQAGEVRLRVAQDLHDTLAHTISLINVQASVALHLLDEQPEAARPALTEIKAASHDALGGLRAALELLRDGDGSAAPTAPAPGIDDLDELVRGLEATGLAVRYQRQPAPDGRSPAALVQLAAYRIVQEALTNVTRHARAGSVRVDVRYRSGPDVGGEAMVIDVADDGVGWWGRARHGHHRDAGAGGVGGRHGGGGGRPRRWVPGDGPAPGGPMTGPGPASIRVVIADDQALVRAGFRALLDAQPDLTVVAEAADGAEAVARAVEHRPDVVLMDIRMPGLDGLAATRRIAADPRLADVKVVILTTFDLDEYVFEALRAGATGFLVKDTEPVELLRAVREVVGGGSLLSPGVTRRLIEEFASRSRPLAGSTPGAAAVIDPLTDREREIVALVGHGLSSDEIAARLVISAATAKTHVSRAMTKLGARDRAQLVVFAYEAGLVRPGWRA